MWRACLLPANLLVFTYLYVAYIIRGEKSRELLAALREQDVASAGVVYDSLVSHGLWSVERMLATPRAQYPPELSRYQLSRDLTRDIKERVRMKYYARLWLTEKGLEKFLRFEGVEGMPRLDEMAYWYPGQINDVINTYTLDVSERHAMKEGVHRFKAAMSSLRLRSTTVVSKLLEYDRKFASDAHHFAPENVMTYVREKFRPDYAHAWYILQLLLFVTFNHYLVLRGTPASVPGTSDLTLSLLLFYAFPDVGALTLYVIIAYRAVVAPVKTLLLDAVGLEMWMLAASALRGDTLNMILLSVLPTLVFAVCINALKFQPVLVRHPETRGLVLSVSGHGLVDTMVTRLYREKRVSWLSRCLLGLHVERDFEWSELETLKVDGCDVTWHVIREMIAPAVAAGRLKHLLIVDNRCLTDDDVREMIDSLGECASLRKLGVSFRPSRALTEAGYRWVFWDSCAPGVSTAGVRSVLRWAGALKPTRLEALDLQGVPVDDECVTLAKTLHVKHNVKILCTKPEFLSRNVCARWCNNLLTRLVCSLVVIVYAAAQIYLLFNSTASLIQQLPEAVFDTLAFLSDYQ